MRIGRIGSGMVIAVMAALTLAPGATSAAPRTRWVDDDGKAGATSCDGTRTASKTIQAAITASGLGDTVLVCPGVYTGELRVTGDARSLLTIRSVVPGKAIIRAQTSGGEGVLVGIDSDDVSMEGFKLQARTAAPCRHMDAMVRVGGEGTELTSNTIAPIGVATQGSCGYGAGVSVVGGSVRLDSNTIVDFQDVGIIAIASVSRVRSYHDQVRYLHASPDRGDRSFSNAYGMNAVQGASLRVLGSTIESRIPASADDYRLTVDIKLVTAVSGRIVNTTITRGDLGILLASSSGVTVSGVTVTGVKQGLVLNQSTNNTVASSTIHGTTESIHLQSTAVTNTISDTDADGTGMFDCIDDTAVGDVVSNTWTNVTGTGSPPIICFP